MTEHQNITITAVIPVLGETDALARLLKIMAGITDPPEEVIVVDASDSPRCRALCADYGHRYLSTRPGRGHQLNAGAGAATGHVLWFVHADGTPPGRSTTLIRRSIAAGGVGGYFRFHFAGPRGGLLRTLLERLINLRARYGTPYGDQGLFATRLAWTQAGGFPDQPLFEEVRLVRRLRCMGRFTQLPEAMGVSQRRWQRDGWLRRTVENRLLACAYLAGISPHTLARRYQPLHPAAQHPDPPSTDQVHT